MNKKWMTVGVMGFLLLSGGGYWAYNRFIVKPVTASVTTTKAKIGNITKAIKATGTVNYQHAITLTFPTDNSSTAGKIVELNVKEGDTVKAGQVLAKIDETKLKTSVLQAQANVTTAKSKLQSLEDSYNENTRAQAMAALAKAEQSLTAAKQNVEPGYLENQVTLAQNNIKAASDNLAKAQLSGDSSSIQSAQTSLNSALSSLTSAKNLQNGGAEKALAAAEADVTSAQYQVDQQTKGPNEADIRSAQANIQIAQAQLASAQADLNNASIVAPVDAVIISCPLELGQDSDSNSIITLTPTGDKLEVDASIDQADITQCKVGQKVDITLDSYPNQHISGTVNSVALEGSTTQNVTTYELKATVDNNSDLLRAGMNANVEIIAAQATNVLTVPSEALKTSGNQTGVMVPGGFNVDSGQSDSGTSNGKGGTSIGNSRFIPVVIGLDDGTNVEIKSGLKEGQEVVTGTNSASTTTKSSSGSDLLFGGGGPGDGGPPPN